MSLARALHTISDMTHEDDDFDEYVEETSDPVRGSQRLLIIILSVGCLALAISNVVLATRVNQLRRGSIDGAPAASAPAPSAAMAPTPSTVAPPALTPESEPAASPTPTSKAAAPPPSPADSQVAATPPAAERRAVSRARVRERAAPPPREVSEPSAPAAAIASPPSREPERRSRPTADLAPPTPEPPTAELPPRGGTRARQEARVAAVTRTTERSEPAAVTPVSPATPATPERATATWMVQEYGRADAASRARAVADFYGAHSPDGAYWRRVLAEIARR